MFKLNTKLVLFLLFSNVIAFPIFSRTIEEQKRLQKIEIDRVVENIENNIKNSKYNLIENSYRLMSKEIKNYIVLYIDKISKKLKKIITTFTLHDNHIHYYSYYFEGELIFIKEEIFEEKNNEIKNYFYSNMLNGMLEFYNKTNNKSKTYLQKLYYKKGKVFKKVENEFQKGYPSKNYDPFKILDEFLLLDKIFNKSKRLYNKENIDDLNKISFIGLEKKLKIKYNFTDPKSRLILYSDFSYSNGKEFNINKKTIQETSNYKEIEVTFPPFPLDLGIKLSYKNKSDWILELEMEGEEIEL